MSEIRIDSFLIVIFFMYLGVIRHYFNLKSSRRTSVNLLTYMFKGGRKGVAAKHGAILGAALGICAAGIGDWVNPQLLWETFIVHQMLNIKAIATALTFVTAGYAADSDINNSQTK